MSLDSPTIDEIYSSARFQALVRKRRWIALSLLAGVGVFYFAQPLLFSTFPAFFRFRISSAITIGFVYTLAQYAMGGVVAVCFAVGQRRLDREIAAIREAHQRNAVPAARQFVRSQEA